MTRIVLLVGSALILIAWLSGCADSPAPVAPTPVTRPPTSTTVLAPTVAATSTTAPASPTAVAQPTPTTIPSLAPTTTVELATVTVAASFPTDPPSKRLVANEVDRLNDAFTSPDRTFDDGFASLDPFLLLARPSLV